MLFSNLRAVALAAIFFDICSASPVDVVVVKPQHDLQFREALEVAHQPHVEKRLSADFDMTRTWKNEVLFAGSWVNYGLVDAEAFSLAVTCVDCYTKGSVHASLTDAEIINPIVRLDFNGVEAYVDMDVAMSAGATYAVNLFATNGPISLGFPGLSVGLVFYVDLVFTMTSAIDLEGGFWVKVADGAFLEASVFEGAIVRQFFDGLSSKSLPVTVKTGRATFTADLRLRVQCGAEAELMGIGAGAEMGIYANLIEFNAIVDSTPDCALQTTEWWDLNVGAYAHMDVVVDYKTFGCVPTISTTVLLAPTMTQCWISGSPHETGGAPTSTVTTISEPTGSSGASQTISYIGSAITSNTPTTITSAASVTETGSSYATGSSWTYKFPTNSTTDSGDDLVTSTLYTTTVYTITSCAASVPNCPASYQQEILVTQTVDVYTTVCPASATITPPTTTSSTAAGVSTPSVALVITDVVVLIPCQTPVVETFVAPTISVDVQTVTATIVRTDVPSDAASSFSLSKPSSSPFPGAGKEVQQAYSNGTASAYPSSYGTGTGTGTSTGTGVPKVNPTTTTSPSKTAVTAGASSRSVAGGLVAAAAMVVTCLLL